MIKKKSLHVRQFEAYYNLAMSLDSKQLRLLSRYECLNARWLKELGVMK